MNEVDDVVDNPQILHFKDYDLENVLDLSDNRVLEVLGLRLRGITHDSYLRTQTLGSVVKEKGFSGIIFKTRKGKAKNIVVFNKD
ncbi:MAG: hypothetical protein H6625_08105 [Bdellovibrionaceae bacterium]|nr:hypothetical protein [Pseudobdellovibrionaceae bacterium]